jgi:sorting nexin-1/2/sorting nexin-4
VEVCRRFNEFYKLRVAMVKRFPGCFVPSIPDKTITMNDEELIRKRRRYLGDFLRQMCRLPHLYWSEEFQALLRSK